MFTFFGHSSNLMVLQTAAWRCETITCCESSVQPDAEPTTEDSQLNYTLVMSASILSTVSIQAMNYMDIIEFAYLDIFYNINSKKKIKFTYFTITSQSWYIFKLSKRS